MVTCCHSAESTSFSRLGSDCVLEVAHVVQLSSGHPRQGAPSTTLLHAVRRPAWEMQAVF